MSNDEKIPVNFRFERTTKATLKALSKATGFTETLILEDALKCFFGMTDKEAIQRRKFLQSKFKNMDEPFSSLREYEESEIMGNMAQQFTLTV